MADNHDSGGCSSPHSPLTFNANHPAQPNGVTWLKTRFERLLPHRQCRFCQGWCRDNPLCPNCLQALTDTQERCIQCALPLKPTTSDKPLTCGECISNPPAFSQSITAGHYQAPINHWINNFKIRRDLRDGHLLSRLLLTKVQTHYADQPLPQLLIPVPLHWSRLLGRSFNQSAWLAQQLKKALGINTILVLKRHSQGRAQKQLNRAQRQKNLKNAFSLKTSSMSALEGKHVALIDDVVTTSATARVISQQLKDVGVARIDIWSLARTDKTDFHH